MENPQKQHYENIHNEYAEHYYDKPSMKYREEFIYKYLFSALDLNNKKVADLACGSGYNSLYLKKYFPHAELTGFDISSKACADYSELVGRPAYVSDLTIKNSIPPEFHNQFDAVMIVGGLHHCVADLQQTFKNIHLMLKPGGHLLMMEPNKTYFLERVRKFWYKHDRFFEAGSEEALSHAEISDANAELYTIRKVFHLGGPAFFLVLNSLIFRLPLTLKKLIAFPLTLIERVYNLLPGKILYPYFIAQWTKK